MINKSPISYVDVSVIIPCHNYARTLPRAIDSILKQTVRPLEILVIDDASNDYTKSIVETYATRGVSYVRVEHGNLADTRNSAAAATTGTFLLYVDADDYLPATYIERCIEKMTDERVGLVYGDIQYVHEKRAYIENPEFDTTLLGRFNFISSNALIRRQAYELAGGYRNIPHAFEDWDFHRRVVRQGYIGAKADTFAYYDIHTGSLTDKHARSNHASYMNDAALLYHPLTVFTIFTEPCDIESYLLRLTRAGFNPALLHVMWINTSNDTAFDLLLRSTLTTLSFGSVQYVHWPASSATDLMTIRAWHRMLVSDNTDYVLSLSPTYVLPANGIHTMLSDLQEDICAVFAPCEKCGNANHDGPDITLHPCFCCALVRRGSMHAIIPGQVGVSNRGESLALRMYKHLRWQGHVLHHRDIWKTHTQEVTADEKR